VLGANKLLAMAKNIGGIHPIRPKQGVFLTYYSLHCLTTLGAVSRTPIFPSVWNNNP
jgi:hypothetical protein